MSRHQAAWHWAEGASLVRASRLHMTLHFLGNVPSDRLDALKAALQVPFKPFDMRMARAELWPRGLAVLQPDPVPDALRHLHAALGGALEAFGLTPARTASFRPHVTLARRALGSTPPDGCQPASAPAPCAFAWRVRSHVLVQSPANPADDYRLLQRYR